MITATIPDFRKNIKKHLDSAIEKLKLNKLKKQF